MLVHTQVCAATAETGEHRRAIGSDRSARRALALDVYPRPQLTQHTDSRSQRRRRREAQGRGGLRLRHCIRLPPLLRVWIAACPITSPAPHTPPTSPPCTPSHSSAHLRADLLLDLRGVLLSALNKFWFFNLWFFVMGHVPKPPIARHFLSNAAPGLPAAVSRSRALDAPARAGSASRISERCTLPEQTLPQRRRRAVNLAARDVADGANIAASIAAFTRREAP